MTLAAGAPASKYCKKCLQDKPVKEFGSDRSRSDGLQFHCLRCVADRVKRYREEHPDKVRETKKQQAEKNKIHIAKYQAKYRKANAAKIKDLNFRWKFGITREQYEKMAEAQNHSCSICRRHKTEFKKALHVDHHHKSGRIRGLLCNRCNTAIGLLKDSSETAARASAYLSRWCLTGDWPSDMR